MYFIFILASSHYRKPLVPFKEEAKSKLAECKDVETSSSISTLISIQTIKRRTAFIHALFRPLSFFEGRVQHDITLLCYLTNVV